MDTIIKEEFSSLEELTDFLKENKFIENRESVGFVLQINKFLREDLSINLELLEIAISTLVEWGATKILIDGTSEYAELRGSSYNSEEETSFIKGFVSAVSNEFSSSTVEVTIL